MIILLILFGAFFIALLVRIISVLAEHGGYNKTDLDNNHGISAVFGILLGLSFSTLFALWFWA